MKLLTLEEWCERAYENKRPTLQTLQRWARNGNLYPAPEKHGKEYRVREDTIYIKPNSMTLSKKILKAQNSEAARTAFMEKVINDTAANKI